MCEEGRVLKLTRLKSPIFEIFLLKHDCDINTSEMLSFLPLINNSVTRGNSFVLESETIIMSPKPKNLRNHY